MKTTLLLFSILFFSLCVLGQKSQSDSHGEATFCGRIGESGPGQGIYSLRELQDCDFKITPIDSSLTVTQFKLSLVAKDKSYAYKEISISGNSIPDEYRSIILSHTKNVFLEYIVATKRNGAKVNMKPIAIRIQ